MSIHNLLLQFRSLTYRTEPTCHALPCALLFDLNNSCPLRSDGCTPVTQEEEITEHTYDSTEYAPAEKLQWFMQVMQRDDIAP